MGSALADRDGPATHHGLTVSQPVHVGWHSGGVNASVRQESAVAAAIEAAGSIGLLVEEPKVLYDVFSVVVHLAPSPVVARVPTVLGRAVLADRSGQLRQMRLELETAAWLASTGFPCVQPAHPEPLEAGGHALTLWQLVEQLPDPIDEATSGALVAHLHAGLIGCPTDLDWMVPLDAAVPDGIRQLVDTRPEYVTHRDVERAEAEWAVLAPWVLDPDVHAATFPGVPVQAIHGDAPFYNLIVTPSGVLSSDFEHVGLGPAEWDLAGVPPAVRAGYDAAARELGTPPLDDRVLALCERGRVLQMLAVLPLADQVPGMAEALEPMVAAWRAGPALTDLRA